MTITLKNFGPIKELTMDLTKNLHLLYGESSVGKSYAVIVVYTIVKKFLENSRVRGTKLYAPQVFIPELSTIPDSLQSLSKEIAGRIITEQKEEFSRIDDLAKEAFQIVFEQFLLDDLRKSLEVSFGSLSSISNGYTKEAFSITLTFQLFIGLKR